MPLLNTQQPALVLNENIALQGIFPSFGGGGGSGMTMAMFHTYAFGYNPGGSASATGPLLPINQNQAMFSLLGTQYGGNGQTNFQLPNLIGRQLTGTDDGSVGEQSGGPTVDFVAANYPTTVGGPAVPMNEDGPSLEARYFIALQGVFPSREGGSTALNFLGSIVKAAYSNTPGGYAACEGQLLSIAQNTALFSLIGTMYGGNGTSTFALPDLRGKTLIGAGTELSSGTTYVVGEVVGQNAVTITNANLPTNMGGQGVAINNIEPSVAVNFYIIPFGIFPSNGSGSPDSEQPFIGEILAFAGNFIPGDGIACDGRLLQIADYDTLFALIGTTYGGDGQTTFGVPDLRGRSIVGLGANNSLGETVGNANITLTSADFGNLNYAGTDAPGTHFGGDGNDRIDGKGGADSITGGKGNDYLIGGAGGDAINGGDGTDTADYRSNATVNINISLLANTASGGDADGDVLTLIENLIGSDTRRDILIGNNGNNTLIGNGGIDSIRGEGGDDIMDGGAGGDSLTGGAGLDIVTYANSIAGVTINLDVSLQVSAGDASGDNLFFIENIIGSALADRITGNLYANILSGGAGDDIINGGAGSDTIEGGAGADTIDGGTGVDTITYASSTLGVSINLGQVLQAGAGDGAGDQLTNVESVIGSSQGDSLTGSGANNRLDGSLGADRLDGAGGIDNLIGGGGADTFRFALPDANVDYILDWQDGSDHIELTTALAANFAALTISNNGSTNVVVSGLAGGATIGVKAALGFTLDAGDFVFV